MITSVTLRRGNPLDYPKYKKTIYDTDRYKNDNPVKDRQKNFLKTKRGYKQNNNRNKSNRYERYDSVRYMGIKIENERQLNTAQEFVEFIKEHNRKALAEKAKNVEDTYDIAIRMASLINTMAKTLAVKQTEIDNLRKEAEGFKARLDELEREIRVSKDLLAISRVVKDDVK